MWNIQVLVYVLAVLLIQLTADDLGKAAADDPATYVEEFSFSLSPSLSATLSKNKSIFFF